MHGIKHPSVPFRGLPFLVAVASGEVSGWRVVQKFGRNSDIGVTPEDLWEVGGVLVWPTVAGPATYVSTDVDDTSAGTGARTVTAHGLLADLTEATETVDMDGTTPVVGTVDFWRLNAMHVETVGSTGANEGGITASIGGNPQRYIEPKDGLDHGTHYTVPAGMQAFLVEAASWQGNDATQDVALWHRRVGGSWEKHYHLLTYQEQVGIQGHYTDGFGPGDDIYMGANKDGAAGANINSAGLYTLLIKER